MPTIDEAVQNAVDKQHQNSERHEKAKAISESIRDAERKGEPTASGPAPIVIPESPTQWRHQEPEMPSEPIRELAHDHLVHPDLSGKPIYRPGCPLCEQLLKQGAKLSLPHPGWSPEVATGSDFIKRDPGAIGIFTNFQR